MNYPGTKFPYYEIDELAQGTEEWLLWRKSILGSSDAATIMNENPWSSRNYLLKQKLGEIIEFQGNAATAEGKYLEIEAREKIIDFYEIELQPTLIQDGKISYIAASLDAIDKNHSRVFEIKCGLKSYDYFLNTGKIPDYYFAQLQHILMITQLNFITYVAYRPTKEILVLEVPRDDSYISDLRIAEQSFAKELLNYGHKLQSNFQGRKIHRKTLLKAKR
jgi:putative phage-type endonuclease